MGQGHIKIVQMQARARDFAIVIKHWYSIVSVVVALYCKYLVAEIAAALHSALKIGENVFCKFLRFSKKKKIQTLFRTKTH